MKQPLKLQAFTMLSCRSPVSRRHTCRTFLVAALLSATCSHAADVPLQLQISNETAPPGGWVQIKVFSSKPQLIQSGALEFTLDPSVFGPVAHVSVFSADGLVSGLATVQDGRIALNFNCVPSPSLGCGGIGQLPGLPLAVVNVPILATATVGKTVTIEADPIDKSYWNRASAKFNYPTYIPSVIAGSVKIGGRMSVSKVSPGGGYLPSGTEVSVQGTGFTSLTTLAIEGVAVSETRYVSPQEIRFVLGAPAELNGKKLVLRDSADPDPVGSEVTFFSSMQPTGFQGQTYYQGVTLLPIFPLQTLSGTVTDGGSYSGDQLAIQNPNLVPVDVTIELNNSFGPLGNPKSKVTIPAGGVFFTFVPSVLTFFALTPSAPIQAIRIPINAQQAIPVRPLYYLPPQVTVDPPVLSFTWQIGTPFPEPKQLKINQTVLTMVSIPPDAPWLSATAASASVNPTGLSAGIYRTTLTLTSNYLLAAPIQIPVSLIVTTDPVPAITANPTKVDFSGIYHGTTPSAQTVTISGTGDFSIRLDQGVFADYGKWLQVSPLSGTLPATLTVSVDPSNVSAYGARGFINVYGPRNTLALPVALTLAGFTPTPASVTFSAKTGSPLQTGSINVNTSTSTFTASASTTSGRPWLRATVSSYYSVALTADPSGLPAGTYTGTVTISAPNMPSADVPVTLVLWDTPPGLHSTPAALTFVYPVGVSLPLSQSVTIDSGGIPVSVFRGDDSSGSPPHFITPTQFSYEIAPGSFDSDLPGVYTDSIKVTGPAGTITIPVTIVVTSSPAAPPMIGSITSAASQTVGPISPGEIIALRGYAVGPPPTTFFTLDSSGKVATNYNGTQVLFDGQPAPIIYASEGQVNAIVPYEVNGKTSTKVEVVYNGIKSQAWGVPIMPSVPAIFTLDGTGVGRAAALNQDNTVNDPSNPAPRGTIVQIYATGEGQTLPPGVTGSITHSAGITPLLQVKATVDGKSAIVRWAGETPESVTGLLAANVALPFDVTPGPEVPVTITIGDQTSVIGTTIAVK